MRKYMAITSVFLAVAFFLMSAVRYNISVDTYNQSATTRTIVIDAGHGGEDGGSSTASGLRESDINLEIALRMEQILALCGIHSYMIRDTDISVYSPGCETLSEKKVSDLKNRVEMINSLIDPVVISIHQNHFSQERYHGAQVFYADTIESANLAESMQTTFREVLDHSNTRKCKKADSVYLMKHINCTGILIECGFLSNHEEALLLQSATYQKKFVIAAASALTDFVEGSSNYEV